ncbi:hypothetical protein SAMN05421748_108245 [Paractinoplanes atraurantiacus]|uniref:Uncharacterized protein n=1 Tax=Paractinoplanes atraurantiacus TaxID=1036182 RepID=A0A285ILE4_9ACTN|nr:hypothetical protein SAMN05421748_108245 [Actinoplanes atraurantiacus]
MNRRPVYDWRADERQPERKGAPMRTGVPMIGGPSAKARR